MKLINNFLQELAIYQSNHYGMYDRNQLILAYDALSDKIKQYLTPKKSILQMLWRGCDGLSETRAISFTNSKSNASIFGTYSIPFGELVDYSGLIDSENALKLANKLKLNIEIGDDEGEVIVLNPTWNKFNIEKYRN